VLSPLLFSIVLASLSKEFREGLPMDVMYADDLVLIAEAEELLVKKIQKWLSITNLRLIFLDCQCSWRRKDLDST